MQRQRSLFELQPSLREEVEHGRSIIRYLAVAAEAKKKSFLMALTFSCCCEGIDRDGCSLSGVSSRVHWLERKVTSKTAASWRSPPEVDDDDDDSSEDRGIRGESEEEEEEGEQEVADRADGEIRWPIRRLYKGLHLTLNLEAASLLPVVLRLVDIFSFKRYYCYSFLLF